MMKSKMKAVAAASRASQEICEADLVHLIKTLVPDPSLNELWMSKPVELLVLQYSAFLCALPQRTSRLNKVPLKKAILQVYPLTHDYADFWASKVSHAFSVCWDKAKHTKTGERLDMNIATVVNAMKEHAEKDFKQKILECRGEQVAGPIEMRFYKDTPVPSPRASESTMPGSSKMTDAQAELLKAKKQWNFESPCRPKPPTALVAESPISIASSINSPRASEESGGKTTSGAQVTRAAHVMSLGLHVHSR